MVAGENRRSSLFDGCSDSRGADLIILHWRQVRLEISWSTGAVPAKDPSTLKLVLGLRAINEETMSRRKEVFVPNKCALRVPCTDNKEHNMNPQHRECSTKRLVARWYLAQDIRVQKLSSIRDGRVIMFSDTVSDGVSVMSS
ncbi:hypothetical protein L484_015686 [Morus notabilis]|uniref:Uncharacterized protein n=1 Tax=Morus notabilis TaxID=981085 RepID=W9SPJ7_9ROSA|nr:hypothetical protein L484_015686 [Morus notabilis]